MAIGAEALGLGDIEAGERRCEVWTRRIYMPTKDRGPLASARSRARRTTVRYWNGPVRITLFDGNDVDHLDELPA